MCKVNKETPHVHSMFSLESCQLCTKDRHSHTTHMCTQPLTEEHHVRWTDQPVVMENMTREPKAIQNPPKSILKQRRSCVVFIHDI